MLTVIVSAVAVYSCTLEIQTMASSKEFISLWNNDWQTVGINRNSRAGTAAGVIILGTGQDEIMSHKLAKDWKEVIDATARNILIQMDRSADQSCIWKLVSRVAVKRATRQWFKNSKNTLFSGCGLILSHNTDLVSLFLSINRDVI